VIAALVAAAALGNPYLEAVSDLPAAYVDGGCRGASGHMDVPRSVEHTRSDLVDTYSWAIPTTEAIDRIRDFSGGWLVDFGAGTGYWAHLLDAAGADVAAIDDWSWGRPAHLWHPVELGSYERLHEYRDRTLLLVWPPRNEMPLRALRAWGGDRLVYVGELLRGNGNPSLFDAFDSDWVLVARIDIPQWFNRSDAVYLLARGPARPWVSEEVGICAL
jgi:hypothetical protein